MLSSNMKRVFNGRVLAAGFVALLAATLVIGLMPSAIQDAESAGGLQVSKPDPNGLTLTLHFAKGKGKELVLAGCSAIELGMTRPCKQGGSNINTSHLSAAAIQWNGLANGSGCVIVGGVEFCW